MDSFDRHIHDQLLHFMKSQPFLDFFQNDLTENNEKWCPFSHDFDTPEFLVCYKTNSGMETLQKMLEKYRLCNQMLDSNRYYLDSYAKTITSLQYPETIKSYDNFAKSIESLAYVIKILDINVQDKLKNITCLECIRLDESLVDYQNHCKYSSIIMAVSAVEYRLHRMIKKVDEVQYEKQFGNATFGQIIKQFTDEGGSEDIKKLLDPTHLPLIQLLNKYRILSAHPKSVDISDIITDSIVSLSFAFLTDPKHSPYTSEELICDSPHGGGNESSTKNPSSANMTI
jgi:hypothetical protein